MRLMKDEILARIHSAFCDVARPKLDELQWHPNSIDEVFIESFVFDTATNWWEVSAKVIEYECDALTGFSFKAYAFYLPAYMTWVLKNYETSESNTVDYTLYNLNLHDCSEEWRRRAQSLSVNQSKAVLDFLKFMSLRPNGVVDTDAAKRAIESYWGRFEDPFVATKALRRSRKNRSG